MAGIIWPHDVPGAYHDAGRCQCNRHCLNCFEDLDKIIPVRARLIAEGHLPASAQIGPRHRYCSPYCRGRAKRERALDRLLKIVSLSEEGRPTASRPA